MEEVSRRRLPKGNKRDRTRAKLLEAARSLIREKGYENTTLEDIAVKAGIGQTYWAPIKPRALAEATIAALPNAAPPRWAV